MFDVMYGGLPVDIILLMFDVMYGGLPVEIILLMFNVMCWCFSTCGDNSADVWCNVWRITCGDNSADVWCNVWRITCGDNSADSGLQLILVHCCGDLVLTEIQTDSKGHIPRERLHIHTTGHLRTSPSQAAAEWTINVGQGRD